MLLGDHKVVFELAGKGVGGLVATQGSDGERRPLILSVVRGAPAGRSAVGPGPCSGESALYRCVRRYGGFARRFDLAEVAAAPPPSPTTATAWVIHVSEEILFIFFFFFLEHAPNDSLG